MFFTLPCASPFPSPPPPLLAAPFFLSGVQFALQHLLARACLSSGLVRRRREEQLSWRAWCWTVLPNGLATGLDIGLSNYSLVFISLSFYVMCKSATPLFLLLCAFAMGLERPTWEVGGVMLVICAGLALLVEGEFNFHAGGFSLVMLASLLAGLRWTITQILLQGHARGRGSAGGSVEVIVELTPIMCAALALLSAVVERPWGVLAQSTYFSSAWHVFVTFAVVSLGALIAFVMVWTEFALIASTSALTFMVAGTFKEVFTVGAAVLFLHEPFSAVNAAGLVVLLAGVSLYNWHKYKALRHDSMHVVVLDGALDADAPASRGSSHSSLAAEGALGEGDVVLAPHRVSSRQRSVSDSETHFRRLDARERGVEASSTPVSRANTPKKGQLGTYTSPVSLRSLSGGGGG